MFIGKLRDEVTKFRDSWNFHKMQSTSFGKMLSPNAQALLGDRSFYLSINGNDDLHRHSREVVQSLGIEYEGRRVKRSESPFPSSDVEYQFKNACPSLTEDDAITEYYAKVAHAFSVANQMS